MKTVRGYVIDYTVEEAQQLLVKADLRHEVITEKPWWSDVEITYSDVFIKLDEKWLALAMTTLTDDVCTGKYQLFADYQEAFDYFYGQIRYGARVKNNIFAVIASYSDG